MTARTYNGKDKNNGNGVVVGGLSTSHPSQSARWMGHPLVCGQLKRTNKRDFLLRSQGLHGFDRGGTPGGNEAGYDRGEE